MAWNHHPDYKRKCFEIFHQKHLYPHHATQILCCKRNPPEKSITKTSKNKEQNHYLLRNTRAERAQVQSLWHNEAKTGNSLLSRRRTYYYHITITTTLLLLCVLLVLLLLLPNQRRCRGGVGCLGGVQKKRWAGGGRQKKQGGGVRKTGWGVIETQDGRVKKKQGGGDCIKFNQIALFDQN